MFFIAVQKLRRGSSGQRQRGAAQNIFLPLPIVRVSQPHIKFQIR
jgi:hypothetical protein